MIVKLKNGVEITENRILQLLEIERKINEKDFLPDGTLCAVWNSDGMPDTPEEWLSKVIDGNQMFEKEGRVFNWNKFCKIIN